MSERVPLAELTQADLDADQLEALFTDLETLTVIDYVLVKGATTTHAETVTMDNGRRALAAGARGLQIRYRWQDADWLDTLIRTRNGSIRIVRTRL